MFTVAIYMIVSNLDAIVFDLFFISFVPELDVCVFCLVPRIVHRDARPVLVFSFDNSLGIYYSAHNDAFISV